MRLESESRWHAPFALVMIGLTIVVFMLGGYVAYNGFVWENGFTPCGNSFGNNLWLLWIKTAANLGIWVAFMGISWIYVRLVFSRHMFLRGLILLNAATFMACGVTHLASAWVLFVPNFYAKITIDVLTAIVSVTTMVVVFRGVRALNYYVQVGAHAMQIGLRFLSVDEEIKKSLENVASSLKAMSGHGTT